jgi:uncharacterized protein
MIVVSQLWTYPFKSGKGVSVSTTQFDSEGMCDDRRLVALDKDGLFITARRHAQLLQLSCIKNDDGWLLQHPSQSSAYQIAHNDSFETITGILWKDTLRALDAGNEAASWLSEVLKVDVRIALWTQQSRYSNKYQLETSFSDASPILVASRASVEQACSWAGLDTDVRRFRPNIVVEGVDAFDEEKWSKFQIGDLIFEVLDACVRCILTTRDPDSGDAHPKKQPMKALMENHANDTGQPLFGMNVKLTKTVENASISVGDEISVA